MPSEMQQRALRYRELARQVFDDKARDVAVQLATECDEMARLPASSTVKLFDES
jgi:hypothetical protein